MESEVTIHVRVMPELKCSLAGAAHLPLLAHYSSINDRLDGASIVCRCEHLAYVRKQIIRCSRGISLEEGESFCGSELYYKLLSESIENIVKKLFRTINLSLEPAAPALTTL